MPEMWEDDAPPLAEIVALHGQVGQNLTLHCLDGLAPVRLRALYRHDAELFVRYFQMLMSFHGLDGYLLPQAKPSVARLLAFRLGAALPLYRGEGKFSSYAYSMAWRECQRQRMVPLPNAGKTVPVESLTKEPKAKGDDGPAPGQVDYSVAWFEAQHLALQRLFRRWRKRKQSLKKAQKEGRMPIVSIDLQLELFIEHCINDVPYEELAQRYALESTVIAVIIYDIVDRFKYTLGKFPGDEGEQFRQFLDQDDEDDDDDQAAPPRGVKL